MNANVSLPITVLVEPADTQATSIKEALADYGVTTLSASVDGPEFNISPAEPQQSQWMSEQRLEWTWIASPKTQGPQTLLVSLVAQGKPTWSDQSIEGQIWSGLVQVTVDGQAQESGGFNLGNIDIFAPLNTLASLGLSFPWLSEQIKKRRQKKTGLTSGPAEEMA